MGLEYIGIAGFLLVILLAVIGVPVGFALAMIGISGVALLADWGAAFTFAGVVPHETVASYTLSVMPLFILMGYIIAESGVSKEFYWAMRQWFARFPGGLAIATVFGQAGFAACTGASVASAAIFGQLAYPEMMRYHYNPRLALGSVVCGAPLAVMIPPSALLVIYAVMVEASVGKQLLAGFLPGILTALLFILMISVRATLNRSLGPTISGITWKQRFSSLKGVWVVFVVIVLILGGLYFGIFTPVEAGSFGCVAAFIIGVARGRLKWQSFKKALLGATMTNVLIFTITVGVFLFIRFLALTRLPYSIGEFLIGLNVPPLVIIAGIMGLLILLGMFMEPIGMIMLVVPIVSQAVFALGFDPLWFGILVIMTAEMGLVTPPIGLTAYALKAVLPEVPITEIFRSILWFQVMMLLTLGVLMFFPQIALIIPNTMW